MSQTRQPSKAQPSTPSQEPDADAGESRDDRRAALRGLPYAAQVQLLSPDGPGANDSVVHQAAREGTEAPGERLPHLDVLQPLFGHNDLGGARAHVAPQATRAMGASAFATGEDVVFSGTPSLRTAAHEAAHVVQQRAGVDLEGGVGRAGDRYERHADQVADKVVGGESVEELLDRSAGSGGGRGGGRVQRKEDGAAQAPPPLEEQLTARTWYGDEMGLVTFRVEQGGIWGQAERLAGGPCTIYFGDVSGETLTFQWKTTADGRGGSATMGCVVSADGQLEALSGGRWECDNDGTSGSFELRNVGTAKALMQERSHERERAAPEMSDDERERAQREEDISGVWSSEELGYLGLSPAAWEGSAYGAEEQQDGQYFAGRFEHPGRKADLANQQTKPGDHGHLKDHTAEVFVALDEGEQGPELGGRTRETWKRKAKWGGHGSNSRRDRIYSKELKRDPKSRRYGEMKGVTTQDEGFFVNLEFDDEWRPDWRDAEKGDEEWKAERIPEIEHVHTLHREQAERFWLMRRSAERGLAFGIAQLLQESDPAAKLQEATEDEREALLEEAELALDIAGAADLAKKERQSLEKVRAMLADDEILAGYVKDFDPGLLDELAELEDHLTFFTTDPHFERYRVDVETRVVPLLRDVNVSTVPVPSTSQEIKGAREAAAKRDKAQIAAVEAKFKAEQKPALGTLTSTVKQRSEEWGSVSLWPTSPREAMRGAKKELARHPLEAEKQAAAENNEEQRDAAENEEQRDAAQNEEQRDAAMPGAAEQSAGPGRGERSGAAEQSLGESLMLSAALEAAGYQQLAGQAATFAKCLECQVKRKEPYVAEFKNLHTKMVGERLGYAAIEFIVTSIGVLVVLKGFGAGTALAKGSRFVQLMRQAVHMLATGGLMVAKGLGHAGNIATVLGAMGGTAALRATDRIAHTLASLSRDEQMAAGLIAEEAGGPIRAAMRYELNLDAEVSNSITPEHLDQMAPKTPLDATKERWHAEAIDFEDLLEVSRSLLHETAMMQVAQQMADAAELLSGTLDARAKAAGARLDQYAKLLRKP